MLTVLDLSKVFADGDLRIEVLNKISFCLASGDSMAVTGPSGCGKSTLLNILAGVLLPDAGSVQLYQDQVTLQINHPNAKLRTAQRRQSIGYVHQFFNLIPTLTVQENVELPLQLNKMANTAERAMAMLSRVDLAAQANVFPEKLSGGQQQRVAVARALVDEPSLVLADEPTGNLDNMNSDLVSELLFSTAKETGAMLVVATHSDAVAQRADHCLSLGD